MIFKNKINNKNKIINSYQNIMDSFDLVEDEIINLKDYNDVKTSVELFLNNIKEFCYNILKIKNNNWKYADLNKIKIDELLDFVNDRILFINNNEGYMSLLAIVYKTMIKFYMIIHEINLKELYCLNKYVWWKNIKFTNKAKLKLNSLYGESLYDKHK